MKQVNRHFIHARRQIRTLGEIAPIARKREVRQFVAALMLPGDDVLDVKWDIAEFFGQSAILATIVCTLPNQMTRLRINHVAGAPNELCLLTA